MEMSRNNHLLGNVEISILCQPLHVPKFGNWEGDNIPYTSYFENARKDRNTLGKKNFNPNDPEDNPDAFVSGIFPAEFDLRTNDNYESSEYKAVQVNNSKSSYKSVRSANSGYGSDNSSPDFSIPLPPNQRRSKNSDEERPVLSSRTDAMHEKPSIPKFGVWDGNEAASKEGFTVIFNKVKQDRQVAANKLPSIPAAYPTSTYGGKINGKPSSKSKICCIFPRVNE